MFQLTVRGPDGSEKLYFLSEDQGLLVGRDETADIVLPSDRVSRRHARFFTIRNTLHVEDLDSQAGVFVGGARVKGTAEIRPGPPIEIGEFTIRIKRDENVSANDYLGTLQGTGAMQGRTLTLPAEKGIIGREAPADIVIADDSVSRKHAEIRRLPNGSFVIRDLNSSNGTHVNNVRLPPQSDRPLRPGDKVHFGDTTWTVGSTHQGPSADVQKSRTRVLVSLVAVTLIVLVTIALAFITFKPQETVTKSETYTDPAVKCQEYVDNQDYEHAITWCQKAYEQDPIDVDVRKKLRAAQRESKYKGIYEQAKARANVDEGAALEKYFQIDPGSRYFIVAQPEVQDIIARLKPRDLNACREATKKKDKPRAIEACTRFIDFTCNCPTAGTEDVKKLLKSVDAEKAAQWHCPTRLKPWFDGGDCGSQDRWADACEKQYRDKETTQACVAYCRDGSVDEAQRWLNKVKGEKERSLTLLGDLQFIDANFKSGQSELSQGSVRTAQGPYDKALERDGRICPTGPGLESNRARTMRDTLAQGLTKLGRDYLDKSSNDQAYRYCASAYHYRPSTPGLRDCLDKTTDAVAQQITEQTACEDLKEKRKTLVPNDSVSQAIDAAWKKQNCQ